MSNTIQSLSKPKDLSLVELINLIKNNAGEVTGAILQSEKGAPNGVCPLGADGLINIAFIPHSAISRVIIVADQAARFALTKADAQGGDIVIQTLPDNIMYCVKDDDNLDNESGYAACRFIVYANTVLYSNSISGLQATNSQDAIDEIVELLQTKANLDNDGYVIEDVKAIKTILTDAIAINNDVIATGDTLQAIVSKIKTQLDNLKAADIVLQTNINNEATARANADITLQNNINLKIPQTAITDVWDGVSQSLVASQKALHDALNSLSSYNAIYVNPTLGSDTTGTGTKARPYQTIQKALNPSGTPTSSRTIYVKGSTTQDITFATTNTSIMLIFDTKSEHTGTITLVDGNTSIYFLSQNGKSTFSGTINDASKGSVYFDVILTGTYNKTGGSGTIAPTGYVEFAPSSNIDNLVLNISGNSTIRTLGTGGMGQLTQSNGVFACQHKGTMYSPIITGGVNPLLGQPICLLQGQIQLLKNGSNKSLSCNATYGLVYLAGVSTFQNDFSTYGQIDFTGAGVNCALSIFNDTQLNPAAGDVFPVATFYPNNPVLGYAIAGATAKTTLADADVIPLSDSANSNLLKKITGANLKAALSSTITASNGVQKVGNDIQGINATTSAKGVVQLSSSYTSTSETEAANPKAIKDGLATIVADNDLFVPSTGGVYKATIRNNNTANTLFVLPPDAGILQTDASLIAPLALKANLNSPTLTGIPLVPTAAVNTSTTQAASTEFVNTQISTTIASLDVMVFKGVIDCSTNPNYPAGNAGETYRISVAGKIGGASGVNVESGDLLICLVDNSSAGNQASVGANWNISQVNIDGAVVSTETTTTDNDLIVFSGTSGKVVKKATASTFKTLLSLENVDNTSDANKPVSTATQTALNLKQNVIIEAANEAAMLEITGPINTTIVKRTDLSNVLFQLTALPASTLGNWQQIGGGGSGGGGAWGDITGTLSDQTDLQDALDDKQDFITAGTSAQYYRGDKTMQTLDKAAVGLIEVPNVNATNLANDTIQGIFNPSNTPIVTGDNGKLAFEKAQGQLNNKQGTNAALTSFISAGSSASGVGGTIQTPSFSAQNEIVNTRHNLLATTDPTSSNDTTQGYTTSSKWLNRTTTNEFYCVSNNTGAAVWQQVNNITNLPVSKGGVGVNDLSGKSLQSVRVNAAANGYEFFTPTTAAISVKTVMNHQTVTGAYTWADFELGGVRFIMSQTGSGQGNQINIFTRYPGSNTPLPVFYAGWGAIFTGGWNYYTYGSLSGQLSNLVICQYWNTGRTSYSGFDVRFWPYRTSSLDPNTAGNVFQINVGNSDVATATTVTVSLIAG